MNHFLTVKEIQEIAGVKDPETVRKWIRKDEREEGILKIYKPGKSLLITRESFQRFMESKKA